jgi:hypothetical protein
MKRLLTTTILGLSLMLAPIAFASSQGGDKPKAQPKPSMKMSGRADAIKKCNDDYAAAVKKANDDYAAAMKAARGAKRGKERSDAQAAAAKAKKDAMAAATSAKKECKANAMKK